MALIRKQKELMDRANKMNVPVLDTISKLDIDMTGTATARKMKNVMNYNKWSAEVEASLGAGYAKLSQMKDDFKLDVRRQQEEHSVRLMHN